MFRTLSLQLLFLALLSEPQLAVGQLQTVNPDSALPLILKRLEGSPLSLQDAKKHALMNSTSVLTAEAAYMSARGAARREAGAFDPTIFFSLDYLEQDQPSASLFTGAPVLSTTQNISSTGLRLTSPIGTKIEASLSTVKLNTNSSFSLVNPQYTAFGNLSLRQPLLGGFHVSARKQVTKADQQADAAKARYDQAVLAIGTQVEQTYWDLYAAERDYAVQKLTRDQGDAFLNDTRLRAKAGLIGPNQVANARTFLAEQEILLLDREEQLDRLSDQFASLIGIRPDSGAPRFITIDNPPEEFPLQQVDMLVKEASEFNLQLNAAKADVEAMRALSNAAFWEALPSVDLVGSLGGNGLAGTSQNVTIFGVDTSLAIGGGFWDAAHQAVNRDYPTWSVGIEVNIPIGFRSGYGEKDRLEAEVAIADQRYVQQSRLLEEQVRASYRDLANGKRRLEAAKEDVAAAEEQGRIGLISFQNGRSTAFELVRLGTDFAVAQQRYTQALVRSAKAAASLRELTSGAFPGTIVK